MALNDGLRFLLNDIWVKQENPWLEKEKLC